MDDSENSINISVIYDGVSYEIASYANEYRNLMMLIYDKINPEDFGECLGMGRCGTCLVTIIESSGNLTSYDRNEESTLDKFNIHDADIRLACQIIPDRCADGLKLKI